MVKTKRVYDPAERADGARFLVERLWPRGVKKEAIEMSAWLKEVAPSTDLRKWFGHDPAKWEEFKRRYRSELSEKKEELKPLVDAAKKGSVTLLYSAHDTEHNAAIVLREVLEKKRG